MTAPKGRKSAKQWYISNGVEGFDLNSLPRCQATSKSTGKRCGNPAMKGRDLCCVHADLYKPGPPEGNKNSFKHGFYTAEAVAERKAARDFLKEADDLLGEILG